jgi:hypothetical protein
MKVSKVKVIGSGTREDPFRVNLPSYRVLPGSEVYDMVDKNKLLTCDVDVPANEVDEKGALSKEKIRAKYKGHPLWDHEGVTDDVV